MQVRLHTFHGPNRLVPFAAVCAEFDEPPDPAPGGGTAQDRALEQARRRLIARLLGEDGAASAGKPSFAEFAAALAARLQASHVQALHWKIQGAPGGRVRILLGFVDPEAGMLALCGALEIAEAVFGARAGATAAAARTRLAFDSSGPPSRPASRRATPRSRCSGRPAGWASRCSPSPKVRASGSTGTVHAACTSTVPPAIAMP